MAPGALPERHSDEPGQQPYTSGADVKGYQWPQTHFLSSFHFNLRMPYIDAQEASWTSIYWQTSPTAEPV